MFAPSKEEVREFFAGTWRKFRANEPLTPLEHMALDVIQAHAEYHGTLENPTSHAAEFGVEGGVTNPFLHMSLHLAIEEQLSIDQPLGIRAAFEHMLRRHTNRHEALHDVLECLGETVWRSQRDGVPPDTEAYLDCLRRRSG